MELLLFPMCLNFSLNTASSLDGLTGAPPDAPPTGSALIGVVDDGNWCPLVAPERVRSSLFVLSTGATNQNEMNKFAKLLLENIH